MKKAINLMLVMTLTVSAWEINTHRAIDRKAIEQSANLKTFVKNSGISTNTSFYNNEKFEGYHKNYLGDYTYLDYVTNGETNGISKDEWKQKFTGGKPSYQKLIEAGAILEDAQWPHTSSLFDWQDRADGRFVNHFYDAQNSGLGLLFWGQRYQNALLWGEYGIKKDVPISIVSTSSKDNDYSYNLALEYFKKGFTSSNPTERKHNQAKMFVTLGHLLHLMNDMTSPAHTRGDAHPEGDVMEVWGRGGEDGKQNTGYKIVGDSLDDDAGIFEDRATYMPKYSKFSDFITKEATWTSTHFFSKDTMYTKPKPSISDTYETFAGSNGVTDKYYIRSYGDGVSACSDGCVPSGIKLGIRIKSYIIIGLKRYYTGSSEKLIQDKTTSFKGDYAVLKEDAQTLIPRAIVNARNFTNYFFRGQISAEIDDENIIIKNISDPTLVKDRNTATLVHDGIFRFKYTTKDDNTLRDFEFVHDLDRAVSNNIVSINENIASIRTGFTSLISLAPGESMVVPIVRDTSILHKNIVVVYDGYIGEEKGLAVCTAQIPSHFSIITHHH